MRKTKVDRQAQETGAHLRPPRESAQAKNRLPSTVGRPELLVDGSDQAFRKLVHDLLAFLGLHQAIRDNYAAHVGLGGVQYTILQSIRHLGSRQDVGVSDIADHLHLSGSFITVETAKLQKLGFVNKVQSSEDRRKVCLTVTAKGMALFDELAPMQRTVNDVQFGGISSKQFQMFADLVSQFVVNSQEALTLQNFLKGSKAKYQIDAAERVSSKSVRKKGRVQ